jgi:prepilin-type N-terminal cleavage/methylation domain-containing protein
MRKQKGFSLIELLIVVAIILIIAAIAIPNLVRAKMNANQSAAVSALRTLTTAQVSYQGNYPLVGYANQLSWLGPPPTLLCDVTTVTWANSCLIDNVLGCLPEPCQKSSFLFGTVSSVIVPTAASPAGNTYGDYAHTGWPIGATSGQNKYCTSTDGVLRILANTITPGTVTPNACETTYLPIAN